MIQRVIDKYKRRPPTEETEQPFLCGCGGTARFGHAYTAVPVAVQQLETGETVSWAECPWYDADRLPRRDNGVPPQVHPRIIDADGNEVLPE